ncbi:hypothetical protein ACLI4Z_05210 [Natrialbaceae archaeon A-arb3/5]
MKRRPYLIAAGSVASALLAGCVSELDDGSETDGGSTDDENTDGEQTTDDENNGDDHGAVAAVDAYVEAASDEDLEAMAEAMHSRHPFNPDNLDVDETNGDDGWSYNVEAYDNYERELVDEEFDTDEIRDLPYAEFWFEDVDLDDLVEDEEAALVAVTFETTEDGETVEDEEQLITLTEDGEWTVFFEYEEPPEIPDDEPVDDNEYRIVDDLEFDEESEMVTITLDDSIGVDIERVTAYSSSLGTDSWVSTSGGGSINYFASGFDPDGDEIVVTVTVDDEERVVHRETYEP